MLSETYCLRISNTALVITIAVTRLRLTPQNRVTANPLMGPLPRKNRMAAGEFLRGYRISHGDCFE